MPMHKTVVVNVVGLTSRLLGPHTPELTAWACKGRRAVIQPAFPAVTGTAQATYLTGKRAEVHGIVGNGWYFREECEIKFWRQSNRLVGAQKIWETARRLDPTFTCANLFWWYNMYSTVDVSITPRPMYPADGRKIPDLYTHPAEIRAAIQKELGPFPLFEFWGPATSIRSSRWIAEAAKWVDARYRPTLTLIYLPHLDYNLQRLGPDHPDTIRDLQAIDLLCGDLIRHYEAQDARIVILSEYGITPVSRPIHVNRLFRGEGLIVVREELERELLDPGASRAFAVADHQIAHIYLNDPQSRDRVQGLLEKTPGIQIILNGEEKKRWGIDHPRAGDLIAVAEPDAWFTYYYWLDDRRAPDFARTVDIHRKPGYDPVELFIDPAIRFPLFKIGLTLLKGWLGFRTLMGVIPLDAGLVRGSHGQPTLLDLDRPVLLTRQENLLGADRINAAEICQLLLAHLAFEGERDR